MSRSFLLSKSLACLSNSLISLKRKDQIIFLTEKIKTDNMINPRHKVHGLMSFSHPILAKWNQIWTYHILFPMIQNFTTFNHCPISSEAKNHVPQNSLSWIWLYYFPSHHKQPIIDSNLNYKHQIHEPTNKNYITKGSIVKIPLTIAHLFSELFQLSTLPIGVLNLLQLLKPISATSQSHYTTQSSNFAINHTDCVQTLHKIIQIHKQTITKQV